MGFQPSKPHPVEVSLAGTKVHMSIPSAETMVATMRASIAEAKLVEEREYFNYRLKQHDVEMAAVRAQLTAATARADRAERRVKRSR